jgi:hypothetical protein
MPRRSVTLNSSPRQGRRPAGDAGLSLEDAEALPTQLQTRIVMAQAPAYVAGHRLCPVGGRRLHGNDRGLRQAADAMDAGSCPLAGADPRPHAVRPIAKMVSRAGGQRSRDPLTANTIAAAATRPAPHSFSCSLADSAAPGQVKVRPLLGKAARDGTAVATSVPRHDRHASFQPHRLVRLLSLLN